MARVAATNSSKKQILYAVTWVITSAMLVVVLQFVGATESAADPKAFDASTPPDFTMTMADTDVDAPSALYGGVLWTVDDVRIEEGERLLSRAIVEIDVTLTNTLARTTLRVPDSLLSLLSSEGGGEGDARFVNAGPRISLDPGEDAEVTVAFEVGFDMDPQVDELSLRIAEPSRVSVEIQLATEELAGEEPILAAVDNTAETLEDPADPSRDVIVQPTSAMVSVNAGPYRALEEERLAVVTVEVQRTDEDSDALTDASFWALDADGEPVAPVVVARSGRPSANTDELTLLFSFPEGADELSLLAGADGDPVTFSIVEPR